MAKQIKTKIQYSCQSCGAVSPKWMGKCSTCNEWNTYVEETTIASSKRVATKPSTSLISSTTKNKAVYINQIQNAAEQRIVTSDQELNRVLGGGIVTGALILIGGEPGIGKSTLMLQIAANLDTKKILYVSGEESQQQIKLRANRIGFKNPNCLILTETGLLNVVQQLKETKPDVCIIDSIQTLHAPYIDSAAGSVSQIRECASELQRYAKTFNVPIFLIGHITKEGNIAGPKILEHTVDTVLQFEGDNNYSYRLLRTKKNRFGSTAELGIYEMLHNGLREVSNPSELLISENNQELSGISIAATLEGLRPLLIETQALVSNSAYGTPQRSATGFDNRRLNMLLAVLEKRCGFKFGDKDVFVNIAGGIKVLDPAIDLAIICSLLSSFEDVTIPPHHCFAAEVGLSGEVRSVNRVEQRIMEATKLGFKKIFISSSNKGLKEDKFDIELVKVDTVEQVYSTLFQ